MSEYYSQSHEISYMPDELGLDMYREEDQQLYVESSGLRVVGELLLAQRTLTREYYAGNLAEQSYRQQYDDICDQIDSYRQSHQDPRP